MADLGAWEWNGKPLRVQYWGDEIFRIPFPPQTQFIGGATWLDPAYYVKVEREFGRGVILPSFDNMSAGGINFTEALSHLNRVLDDYVKRGVVSAEAAEELRRKQASLSPERTILFVFRTPDNVVAATMALLDGSRYPGEYGGLFTTGFMGPHRIISPSKIQIENTFPDLILPERTEEKDGDVYELIRLDGADGVINTIPAGLAASAHWIAHKYGDHGNQRLFIPRGGVYAVYPDEEKYQNLYEGKYRFVPFSLGRAIGNTRVRISRKDLYPFVADSIGYHSPPLRIRPPRR